VNAQYLVRGLFSSYSELSAFFNECHQAAKDANNLPRDHLSRDDLFDNSEPLILTHHDLNLRNVIMGEDGRLNAFVSLTGDGQGIICRGLSLWRCGGRMRVRQ
jgi:hypothetical protein